MFKTAAAAAAPSSRTAERTARRADRARPRRAAPRDRTRPRQRPAGQDLHPPHRTSPPVHALSVVTPRGVLRRRRHPARGPRRRRRAALRVHQQDERGEAAPRLGERTMLPRRGLRGGPRGRSPSWNCSPPAPAPAPPRGRPHEPPHRAGTWTGSWVGDRLGVTLTGAPQLPELLGLAAAATTPGAPTCWSRACSASTCPPAPAAVHGAGTGLGRRVRELLGPAADRAVVLGYAETATGLGHCVADGVAARALPALHPPPGARRAARPGGFEEEHSHATYHLLLPERPRAARRRRTAGPGRRRVLHRQHRAQHDPRPARPAPARALRGGRARRPAHRRPTATGWPSSRPSSAPASTWWRWRPARCRAARRRPGARTARWSPTTSRSPAATRDPAAVATTPYGWTSAGPPGCRTADGTASPRHTATGWRPPCPAWPTACAAALPADAPAGSSSSAARS